MKFLYGSTLVLALLQLVTSFAIAQSSVATRACKAPEGAFIRRYDGTPGFCKISHVSQDKFITVYDCPGKDRFVGTASFVYHAGFNVISAKIENTAPNVQHVNLMAFCYGFGTNKPRGHANIRFTIPTQGKIDGLYKGLNYACRTEQGLQLSLYVYSMNEGDIDPCARNPLVPIG